MQINKQTNTHTHTHTHITACSYGLKIWGSNSGRDNRFSLHPNPPNRPVVTPSLLFNVIRGSLPVVKCQVR